MDDVAKRLAGSSGPCLAARGQLTRPRPRAVVSIGPVLALLLLGAVAAVQRVWQHGVAAQVEAQSDIAKQLVGFQFHALNGA